MEIKEIIRRLESADSEHRQDEYELNDEAIEAAVSYLKTEELYEESEDDRLIDKLLKGEFKRYFGARTDKIRTKDIALNIGFCWFGKQRFITITLFKWRLDIGILQKWYPPEA